MKPLIVANWKMNPQNLGEAKKIFDGVNKGMKGIKGAEVVICPPFVYLTSYNLKAENCKLGGQDCFWEESGAFTGEISPGQLKNLGCQYVILGHSERRQHLKEDDEMMGKKIGAALSAGLTPILCIGETAEEKDAGKTLEILRSQLQQHLEGLVIAYEPRWAIGTGTPCDTGIAKEIYSALRETIKTDAPILYGGSVNSKNAAGYLKEAGMQGLLVGGASLDVKEFIDIIKNVS